MSDTSDFPSRHVYLANFDGNQVVAYTLRRVMTPAGYYAHPMMSPDGRHVVFWGLCEHTVDLWLSQTDTCHARRLTHGGVNCHPAWSPDSQKIVFAHHPDPLPDPLFTKDLTPWNICRHLPGLALKTLNPFTGQTTAVTDQNADHQRPSWSPDGRRIAYVSGHDLWTIDLHSRHENQITRDLRHCYRPAWHPSGKQLAFNNKGPGNHYLWSIQLDGTDLEQLSPCTTDDHQSVYDHGSFWSADGRKLLFHSNRSGTWGIWCMDMDMAGAEKFRQLPITGVSNPGHVTCDQAMRIVSFDAQHFMSQ